MPWTPSVEEELPDKRCVIKASMLMVLYVLIKLRNQITAVTTDVVNLDGLWPNEMKHFPK